MKQLYALVGSLFLSSSLLSQTEKCATMPNHKKNADEIKNYSQRMNEAELKARNWKEQNKSNAKMQSTITVPVVFHCVYKNTTDPSYLHDSVFQRQMNVLNETYSLSNANYSNTRAIFDTLGANTDIQFCFASLDPNGNPTTGINRVQSTTSFSLTAFNDDVKNPSKGGVAPWDPQHYLNVWTCDMSLFGQTFVLGYSTFPGGPDSLDGTVIQYQYLGFQNTGNQNNLGRTTVHEVGHWFGMRHVWGDGQQGNAPCDSTDYVEDTPHANDASQTTCDTVKNTCSNESTHWTQFGIDPPDMVENYMDYSNDGCMTMFTKGQKERMWSFINTARSGLLSNPTTCSAVSIDEFNSAFSNALTIFPNPANETFTVNFATNSIDQVEIAVYDANGRVVKTLKPVSFQNTFDCSALEAGIYFIKISNPFNCAVKKLIVE
jgi:hypothetical protein